MTRNPRHAPPALAALVYADYRRTPSPTTRKRWMRDLNRQVRDHGICVAELGGVHLIVSVDRPLAESDVELVVGCMLDRSDLFSELQWMRTPDLSRLLRTGADVHPSVDPDANTQADVTRLALMALGRQALVHAHFLRQRMARLQAKASAIGGRP